MDNTRNSHTATLPGDYEQTIRSIQIDSNQFLAEIGESEASGNGLAEVYADIRGVLGVPVVNLMYRHLAAKPGRLEDAWSVFRPVLVDEDTHRAAAALVRRAGAALHPLPAIPRSSMDAMQVSPAAVQRTLATLDVYARANSRNLVAIARLQRQSSSDHRGYVDALSSNTSFETSAVPIAEIPPMVELDAVPAGTLSLLMDIGSAVAVQSEQIIVPSLIRHLAEPPSILALIWTALRHPIVSPSFPLAVSGLRHDTQQFALRAGPLTERTLPPESKAIVEDFASAIERMLVIGESMRTVLRDTGAVTMPSSKHR